MSFENKPPIGVNPHWFTHQKRIEDLSSAISRYVEYVKNQSTGNTRDYKYYDVIAKWAYELCEICKLESSLLKIERKIG